MRTLTSHLEKDPCNDPNVLSKKEKGIPCKPDEEKKIKGRMIKGNSSKEIKKNAYTVS